MFRKRIKGAQFDKGQTLLNEYFLFAYVTFRVCAKRKKIKTFDVFLAGIHQTYLLSLGFFFLGLLILIWSTDSLHTKLDTARSSFEDRAPTV